MQARTVKIFQKQSKSTQQEIAGGRRRDKSGDFDIGGCKRRAGVGSIRRSAAPTAIINGFFAVVTRLLDQVQHMAVFIYGPITPACPCGLVSMCDAMETVR